MPFDDLLLSTALEVHGSWIGLHLSRAHMALSLFSIPLSPQRADARVPGLLLQILLRSVPMLPSVFVFGSRLDPRCQLNVIKSLRPSPRVSLILAIFRSRYIRKGYWLVFCKPWERIREEGERISVIHGRFAALILK